MIDYNLIIKKLKNLIKNRENRLNIYLITISIVSALINIIFLKNIELKILAIIFNNYLNDFLAAILILAYINICLSFIDCKIKSLKVLIVIIILISVIWEYIAIHIKPQGVFDYLDFTAYLIGTILYWIIINRFYK